jgi:hypothetical protein
MVLLASRQHLRCQWHAVSCLQLAQVVVSGVSGVPSIDTSDVAVVLEDQYQEWHVFLCVHFGRSASLVGVQVHPAVSVSQDGVI